MKDSDADRLEGVGEPLTVQELEDIKCTLELNLEFAEKQILRYQNEQYNISAYISLVSENLLNAKKRRSNE